MTLAADYAEGVEEEIPYTLIQHGRWEKWGLPRPGGLNAQNAKQFLTVEWAYMAYDAHRQRGTAPDLIEWQQNNPGLFEFTTQIDRIRIDAAAAD